ncbi:leucine--tRNA ligase, cytoplasmic-like [Rosa sericea]
MGFGLSVLATFFKLGFEPNVRTFSTLINGFLLAGRVAEATAIFRKMVDGGNCKPDAVTFGTLIKGLCIKGNNGGALQLLRKMELSPDSLKTFRFLVSGLLHLFGQLADFSSMDALEIIVRSEMSTEEDGKKKFTKRDELLEIEKNVQSWWEEERIFEAKARKNSPKPGEKFFGTFPFPYMNGVLHLGHAFSLSKLEFAAAYHRLRGANVLLPFAFHCTGMPIKASADKLAREVQEFGCPPVFPINAEPGKQEEKRKGTSAGSPPGKKHKGKKSKVVLKSAGEAYQWLIMRKGTDLSDSEIEKFQDPKQWLTYFPPKAVKDLKDFGLGCDWRRSFITTDMNPFYDAFVKWQVRKLKSMGKIVKDVRYTIYSPKDGQPCADHDRASGEGVQPQEYTVIKMEVVAPFPSKLGVLEGRNVFLAAAMLRPETICGQTNAWILPDGKYGAFEINEADVFILTPRAALNLAYQKYSRVAEKPTCLVEINGNDLIGLPLKSPLAPNQIVYALPILTILSDNGTGIVTSLPSDAPEMMAWRDLKSKPALREKYGVREEWIMPFEGRKVEEAEPLTRSKLIEAGEAFIYSEPEQQVVSKSGDECIVALTDQWYITYGEAEWKKLAEECLSGMSFYSDETRRGFEHTLGWLNQWACSRSFGLGTRIPWDEEFLVESLSDSTIYMAYYTIAHFLHNGNMYVGSNSEVIPEHMTDEVWDFIFCEGPKPKYSVLIHQFSSDRKKQKNTSILDEMKQEFQYWYPFDLRVSGKDLIQNHLTFCIYNHAAIMAKKHWPPGFRCNGHLMLNAEKMSKAKGNFKTLAEAIKEFSADATRFSLADAGDGVENANFDSETANAAILRLNKEMDWMKEVLKQEHHLRTGPPSTFADRVFANEINIAVNRTEKNYQAYMFREALKTGVYDLQAARDEYRFSCGTLEGMNRDLVWHFMDVQTRLITPICPHYAEHVWRKILNKEGFVVKAG